MAAMILAATSIGNPGYVPEDYQVFLLTVVILIIHGSISSMPTRWIANFNSVGSTLNIIALIIVIVLIPVATNREEKGFPKFTPSSVVWGSFYPGTDYPNGIALLMTFVALIWTMRSVLIRKNGNSLLIKVLQRLRCTVPLERGMLQCQHRCAKSHCPHQQRGRNIWLVPATSRRIHSD